MDSEFYDLVFSGEIMPNTELSQVKKNLQQLFRLDADKVELLFSGRSITLKKNLSLDAAGKYRTAMKKAGARVDLVEVRAVEQAAAAVDHPVGERVAPGEMESQGGESWTSEPGAQPAKAATARQIIKAPDFDIAEPGALLLEESEKPDRQAVQVDISHLDIRDSSGNLVSADEIKRPSPIEVGSLDVELLPAGSDLLKPDERRQEAKREIDLSDYDLAPPGANLSTEKKETPDPPSVDHIQLLK